MTQDRPAQCGRTTVHGQHDTTEGWCPGLHPTDLRPDTRPTREAAAQRPLPPGNDA